VRAGTTAPLDAASYAEIASDRNPNVNVKYISSAEIKKDSVKKAPIWSAAVGVPNTLKLHCVRAHNAKMLRVSTVSTKDDFTLVEIFQGAGSDESEPEEQNQPNDENQETLKVNIGDWVLVNYDGADFPGEITNIVGFDYEVNVMHKCGAFWKWPLTEDGIFYDRKNVVKKLEPPEVAGTRGQFTFTVVNNSELYGPTNLKITYNLNFFWTLLLFFVTFSNDFANVRPSQKICMSVTEFKKF